MTGVDVREEERECFAVDRSAVDATAVVEGDGVAYAECVLERFRGSPLAEIS